jgi:hypothetical protein
VIPPGTCNVSGGVVLGGGARGLIMRGGVLRYTGTAPETVLTLGDGGTVRDGEKLYVGLQVVRGARRHGMLHLACSSPDWSVDLGPVVRAARPARPAP